MLSEQQRQELWKALDELAKQHRGSPDGKWVMSAGDIEEVERLAAKFLPSDAATRVEYLFNSHFPDLGVPRTQDFEGYEAKIAEARVTAVREIERTTGINGLERLRDAVKEPFFVGWAIAAAAIDLSPSALAVDLESSNAGQVNFGIGYAVKRFADGSLAWTKSILPELAGHPAAQARVLRVSTTFPDVWELASSLGPEVEATYWREFVSVGLGTDFRFINELARKLLAHGRPSAAVDLLALYADRTEPRADAGLIADALETFIATPITNDIQIAPYHLQSLLDSLRSANFDEERLALLEWKLLPGLGYGAPAPTLERRLAADPEFFVFILSIAFKRADGAEEERPAPEAARNAFHVLQEWRIVPGSTTRGGEVDAATLNQWIERAMALLAAADRVDIGAQYIGHVFAHAKTDEDGTWPTLPVRNAIERLGNDHVQRGFRNQIFNSRGVTSRGLTDGGQQERDLAAKFRRWEELIRDRWPRTAAVLRSLADDYEAQGRWEDEEAERVRQGIDSR
jgi:hypothetical protein